MPFLPAKLPSNTNEIEPFDFYYALDYNFGLRPWEPEEAARINLFSECLSLYSDNELRSRILSKFKDEERKIFLKLCLKSKLGRNIITRCRFQNVFIDELGLTKTKCGSERWQNQFLYEIPERLALSKLQPGDKDQDKYRYLNDVAGITSIYWKFGMDKYPTAMTEFLKFQYQNLSTEEFIKFIDQVLKETLQNAGSGKKSMMFIKDLFKTYTEKFHLRDVLSTFTDVEDTYKELLAFRLPEKPRNLKLYQDFSNFEEILRNPPNAVDLITPFRGQLAPIALVQWMVNEPKLDLEKQVQMLRLYLKYDTVWLMENSDGQTLIDIVPWTKWIKKSEKNDRIMQVIKECMTKNLIEAISNYGIEVSLPKKFLDSAVDYKELNFSFDGAMMKMFSTVVQNFYEFKKSKVEEMDMKCTGLIENGATYLVLNDFAK